MLYDEKGHKCLECGDEIGYGYFQQAECFIDHQPVKSNQDYVGGRIGEALAALYPVNHDEDWK